MVSEILTRVYQLSIADCPTKMTNSLRNCSTSFLVRSPKFSAFLGSSAFDRESFWSFVQLGFYSKKIQKVIVPFERPYYDSGTTIHRTTTISSIPITTVFLRIDSPTLWRTKSHSLSDIRLKKRPSTPPLTIDYLRPSIIRTITVNRSIIPTRFLQLPQRPR